MIIRAVSLADSLLNTAHFHPSSTFDSQSEEKS